LAAVLPRRLRLGKASLPPSHQVVVSWAGMRGVVSLAASLALPLGFPGRDLIIFLAFFSILVTLVVQGTTLGWVISKLRVVEVPEAAAAHEEAAVRRAAADAALAVVENRVFAGRELGMPDSDMLREFRRRATDAQGLEAGPALAARRRAARLRLELDAMDAARRTVLDRADRMDAELLHAIEEEFDYEEGRLRRSLGEAEHTPS
jgi:CPA1 family monovalent cation:H+ antiporter